MEQLLSILKLYIDLRFFNVQHEVSTELEGHTLFTLTPLEGVKFNNQLFRLIMINFPKQISCSMTDMNIQFTACKEEQDLLVDAFCDILRHHTNDDTTFFNLLQAYSNEEPFTRLLKKHTLPTLAPFIPIPSPPSPSVTPPLEVIDTKAIAALEEIPAAPVANPNVSASGRLKQVLAGSQSFFVPEVEKHNPELRLIVNLQAALGMIVAEMKKRTQATGGYVASWTQSFFNGVNMIIGDAEAAINLVKKFEAHARRTIVVSDGERVPYDEVQSIIQDVATRLLHVQQNHLQAEHALEITHLLSAQDHAIKLRDLLVKSGRGPIQTEQSGGLSFPASQGFHS